jgi:hypothetical protein
VTTEMLCSCLIVYSWFAKMDSVSSPHLLRRCHTSKCHTEFKCLFMKPSFKTFSNSFSSDNYWLQIIWWLILYYLFVIYVYFCKLSHYFNIFWFMMSWIYVQYLKSESKLFNSSIVLHLFLQSMTSIRICCPYIAI